jgi:hypothetical protein
MCDPKASEAPVMSEAPVKVAETVMSEETVMNGATAQAGGVNLEVLRRKDDLGLMQIRLSG